MNIQTKIQLALLGGLGSGDRLPGGKSALEAARQLSALQGMTLMGYSFYYARMTWMQLLESLSPRIEGLGLSKMFEEICRKFNIGEWITTDYTSAIVVELNSKWCELQTIAKD